jgi:8-oxo-dGTP diphosphatase
MAASPTDQPVAIGVGAVVFRGEDVLLVRRGKPPFLGRWSIPGGELRYGEAIEAAVRREVREETGVEITPGALIGVFEALPGALGEPVVHTVMIDFVAEWTAREPVAGDDALEAQFVPFDEALRRLSWDQTRTALKLARDIRKTGARSL